MQLRREKPTFDQEGVRVVLIGLGEPEKARAFHASLDLPFTILCDPEKLAYAAYRLTYRLNLGRELVHPSSLTHFVRDVSRYGAAATEQDMFQMGGVFGIDRNGAIRFTFRQVRATDRPKSAEALAALR